MPWKSPNKRKSEPRADRQCRLLAEIASTVARQKAAFGMSRPAPNPLRAERPGLLRSHFPQTAQHTQNVDPTMATDLTVIAGIVIPSRSPAFLALVGFHVALALVALAAGIAAMLSDKKPGRHPTFGTAYYWSLALVCLSASILAFLRQPEDAQLFGLGLGAFTTATVGRAARRRLWPHWTRWHIAGMGSSYVLMLIAFYVDNGRNLPLWRHLPTLMYWAIPPTIGIPLMVRAVRRHERSARVANRP